MNQNGHRPSIQNASFATINHAGRDAHCWASKNRAWFLTSQSHSYTIKLLIPYLSCYLISWHLAVVVFNGRSKTFTIFPSQSISWNSLGTSSKWHQWTRSWTSCTTSCCCCKYLIMMIDGNVESSLWTLRALEHKVVLPQSMRNHFKRVRMASEIFAHPGYRLVEQQWFFDKAAGLSNSTNIWKNFSKRLSNAWPDCICWSLCLLNTWIR